MSPRANRCVCYESPGVVSLRDIGYPTLQHPFENRILHGGVVIETVGTNICGSDQHMVRGRTTAEAGQTLGHEITGIIVEAGCAVERLKVGDLVSVPFNVSCGTCEHCSQGKTHICKRVNRKRDGAAFGYVDMDGWLGGQANYVMVPYADHMCMLLSPLAELGERILDLCLLSDIGPTGYHGAVSAKVTTGRSVYVAGAGPVGLAAAWSSLVLGAGVVIVGDRIPERLSQARSFGCETVDISSPAPVVEQIEIITGRRYVDCVIDAVGFEASAHGTGAGEAPATVLNASFDLIDSGGAIGVPGLYVTGDPGGVDASAQEGVLGVRIGLGWAKACSLVTGQTPVKCYNTRLRDLILRSGNRYPALSKAVGAQVISLEDAPAGYRAFDGGKSVKYIINPNGYLGQYQQPV